MKNKSKKNLIISVVLVLSMMIFNKYTNFILSNIFNIDEVKMFVAIGISFYTFMSVSYLVDIYKSNIKAEKSLLYLSFYLTFFPHVLQGPITKSREFMSQIKGEFVYCEHRTQKALYRIAWGMVQKTYIADQFAKIVNPLFNNIIDYNSPQLIFTICLYAIQIYMDFLSYSNIAIGSASLLGFELKENFNKPYSSKSIAEFWRRWHISLGDWLKEYVYFPLGGSRKGKLRKNLNILIVFLVSGLWHGASFNFIIWGLLHGIYQIISSITLNARTSLKNKFRINENNKIYSLFQSLIVFVLVSFSWIFFRTNSISDAKLMIMRIVSLSGFGLLKQGIRPFLLSLLMIFDNKTIFIKFALVFLCMLIFNNQNIKEQYYTEVLDKRKYFKLILDVMLAILVVFALFKGNSSIDSQFIYFDF